MKNWVVPMAMGAGMVLVYQKMMSEDVMNNLKKTVKDVTNKASEKLEDMM